MRELILSVALLIFLAMGFSAILGKNELTLVIATIMADIVRMLYLNLHDKTLLQEFQEFAEKNKQIDIDRFLNLHKQKPKIPKMEKLKKLFKK
jgi:hypothetical protein